MTTLKFPLTLLFFSFLCLAGCGPGSDKPPVQTDPSAAAALPKDSLITMALRRALVREKDLPDYNLLTDDADTIILSRTAQDSYLEPVDDEGYLLDPGWVPERLDSLSLIVLSQEELQQRANRQGRFPYLELGNIETGPDEARIGLSIKWALPDNSDVIPLTGGGYVLEYVRRDAEWVFNRVVQSWIS